MAKSYIEQLLGAHERIILVSRQHWFILARAIFLEISAILIIFASAITATIYYPYLAVFIIAFGFILLIAPIITMTRDILNWANRQFIVTNRRVMQISGIINKRVIDSSLEKVNDVKMEQSVLGRLFGYGNIEILTASELGVNLFNQIDEPIRFKTAMLNAKEQMEQGEKRVLSETSIASLISQLDELRKQGVLTEEEFQQKKADILKKL